MRRSKLRSPVIAASVAAVLAGCSSSPAASHSTAPTKGTAADLQALHHAADALLAKASGATLISGELAAYKPSNVMERAQPASYFSGKGSYVSAGHDWEGTVVPAGLGLATKYAETVLERSGQAWLKPDLLYAIEPGKTWISLQGVVGKPLQGDAPLGVVLGPQQLAVLAAKAPATDVIRPTTKQPATQYVFSVPASAVISELSSADSPEAGQLASALLAGRPLSERVTVDHQVVSSIELTVAAGHAATLRGYSVEYTMVGAPAAIEPPPGASTTSTFSDYEAALLAYQLRTHQASP